MDGSELTASAEVNGGVPVPPRGRLQRNDCSLSTQIWSHISWILFSMWKEHTNLTTLMKIKSFVIFVSHTHDSFPLLLTVLFYLRQLHISWQCELPTLLLGALESCRERHIL